MSDSSDASDAEDIEAIRERRKAELRSRAASDGTAGGDDAASRDDAADGTEIAGGTADSEPVHVESGDHLATLVGEHDVVLVDFYADWCGPCQMLEPVVASIAAETPATVAKVDVDAHQGLAREYQVQGVPTLFLFADGDPAERLVGMQDESTLRNLVAQYA